MFRAPVYVLVHNRLPDPVWDDPLVPLPNRLQRFKVAEAVRAIKVLARPEYQLIGYAEGAIHAIAAARLLLTDPRIKLVGLTLINPLGITGRVNWFRVSLSLEMNLLHRLKAYAVASPEGRERLRVNQSSVWQYLKQRGFGRVLREDALMPWQVELGSELISQLAGKNGLPVKLVITGQDALVPGYTVLERFSGRPNFFVMLLAGSHYELFIRPERIVAMLLSRSHGRT